MYSDNLKFAGFLRIIRTDHKTGLILSISPWIKNTIVHGTNIGTHVVAQRLGGVNTYTGNILYAEIGTSATAVTSTDSALNAASYRAALSYAAVGNTSVTLQFFFPDGSVANGTYREFGTYIDGTSVLASGQFFSHLLLSPVYVKTAGVDTTFQYRIDLSN